MLNKAKRNFIKNIVFNSKEYKVHKFKYFSGRLGLMLTNINDDKQYFSGTLSIDNIPINKNEVIIKDYEFNSGLLSCLIDNNIIDKQAKSITIGFNKAYLCKLK